MIMTVTHMMDVLPDALLGLLLAYSSLFIKYTEWSPAQLRLFIDAT